MAYFFRLLNCTGAVSVLPQLDFRDDLDALDEAVRQSAAHAVEIWQGERLVARVKAGNAALETTDARSL